MTENKEIATLKALLTALARKLSELGFDVIAGTHRQEAENKYVLNVLDSTIKETIGGGLICKYFIRLDFIKDNFQVNNYQGLKNLLAIEELRLNLRNLVYDDHIFKCRDFSFSYDNYNTTLHFSAIAFIKTVNQNPVMSKNTIIANTAIDKMNRLEINNGEKT